MNTTTMTEMNHLLAAVTAERDHWKANHDNRVNAAKLLTDRTDMPLERVGAYKHYVAALESNQKLRERAESAEAELLAVREDNHSMMLEIAGLRTERDRLAQQKPVATLILSNYGSDFEMFYDLKDLKFDGMKMRLYAAPVPALAMPTDEQIHAAYRTALGQSIRERDMPEIRKFANELLRAAPVVAAPAGFIPTPFLPDDDTRRNDAEFAAQQAATAPNTPAECELLAFYRANRTVLNGGPGELVEVGQCCYGGLKPKRDCASCAVWKPAAPVDAPSVPAEAHKKDFIMQASTGKPRTFPCPLPDRVDSDYDEVRRALADGKLQIKSPYGGGWKDHEGTGGVGFTYPVQCYRRKPNTEVGMEAAPSVPEEWREFVKRTAEVGLHATNSGVECTCYRCVAIRGARALLQSANHSNEVKS